MGTMTFGGANGTRLGNVAAGINAMDAVNVMQYQSLANVLGGGVAMGANGLISAPAFHIQGIDYATVGDAFGALDDAYSNLNSRVDTLATQQGDVSSVAQAASSPSVQERSARTAASGSASTAIGDATTVPSIAATDGNASLGDSAQVAATATNATAVGANSTASANSATAIGQGSQATAENSVAIGTGSVADQANTVSVGNAGNERQITHVATGVNATDAANVGQVTEATQQAITAAQQYTDQKTSNLVTNDNFNSFKQSVSDQFQQVSTRINRVGAMSAAMAGMAGAIAANPGHDNNISAAAGTYGGEGAVAVGISRRLGDRAALIVGGSVSGGGEASGTVGVSYGW
jgi:trimeric autotransporter adhesin